MTRHLAAWRTLALASLACCAFASASASPAGHSASLAQNPLVMRLSKDEFRIAFGVDAKACAARGCSGVIRYRVDWKTDDGTVRSEARRVSYSVLPHYTRAITVDRQFFDTAEGAHTTAVVRVRVVGISCVGGMTARSAALAANNH